MAGSDKGKVILFPKAKKDLHTESQYQSNDESNRASRLREAGGKALDNLKNWDRAIPHDDRVQMALNMESRILERYRIKPNDISLFSSQDYTTDEAFRRDLSRMRLKSSKEAQRKRLMAGVRNWIKFLGYIHNVLVKKSAGVSLESLAGKLTYGTRFHPLQKTEGQSGKLRYLIKAVTDHVTETTSLYEFYRDLADARAEYLTRYGHEMDCPNHPLFLGDGLHESLGDSFEVLDGYESLFKRPFSEYSAEDWNTLFDMIPENYQDYYGRRKVQITGWQRLFNAETTLVDINPDSFGATLWDVVDLYYLPRFYIGYHLWDIQAREVPLNSEFQEMLDYKKISILHRPKDRDLNYLKSEKKRHSPELHQGACYLVLYPDAELSSVVPYIFRYAEEGSQFSLYEDDPYEQELFSYEITNGKPIRGYTLLERIEENKEEFASSLLETAPLVKEHPYLQWKLQREKSLDSFIDKLLDHKEE